MLLTLPRFALLVLSRSVAAGGLSLWPDGDRGDAEDLNLLQLQSGPAQNASASEQLLSAADVAHVLRDGGDCNLCRGTQDWLFILGTGRSGSTTALEMVDAIPGVYLAGENMGVMNTFMRLYDAHKDRIASQEGAENRLLCGIQRFIKTLIGNFDHDTTKVIGFKEIRHLNRKQLAFIKKVFPAAKFVLNTRKNLERQHMSQFQMDIPMMELKNWTKELELFQGDHPDDTFLLRLEEYNSETYNRLLDFMGVSGCYFAFVAHANNGWHWNDDGPHAVRALQGSCEIGKWAKERCVQQVEKEDLMPKLAQKDATVA